MSNYQRVLYIFVGCVKSYHVISVATPWLGIGRAHTLGSLKLSGLLWDPTKQFRMTWLVWLRYSCCTGLFEMFCQICKKLIRFAWVLLGFCLGFAWVLLGFGGAFWGYLKLQMLPRPGQACFCPSHPRCHVSSVATGTRAGPCWVCRPSLPKTCSETDIPCVQNGVERACVLEVNSRRQSANGGGYRGDGVIWWTL